MRRYAVHISNTLNCRWASYYYFGFGFKFWFFFFWFAEPMFLYIYQGDFEQLLGFIALYSFDPNISCVLQTALSLHQFIYLQPIDVYCVVIILLASRFRFQRIAHIFPSICVVVFRTQNVWINRFSHYFVIFRIKLIYFYNIFHRKFRQIVQARCLWHEW